MQNQFLTDLIETAVRKEFQKFLNENNVNMTQLAECHTVKMLEEINKILNTEYLTPDEKLLQITKINLFFPVPPHTTK